MAYILGDLGKAYLILAIWGAKAKYFQEAEDCFQGFGEFNALFREQVSTDPPGDGTRNYTLITYRASIIFYNIMQTIVADLFRRLKG